MRDLLCDGDEVCMVCRAAAPREVELLRCATCAIPWHSSCLSKPPALTDAAGWACPDCGGEGASPSSAPGIEIWRIEDFKPVALPKSDYGKFYSGDSSIVLQMTSPKGGAYLYDVHFWIVKDSSQDEAGTAAIKTVELDSVPGDGEFQNTGLERSEALNKDLKWFSEQGHTIPEPSAADTRYASYLEELSEKDQHAFFGHFYNMYFGQSARGRFTGKKIADKILNKKELEFYKWEGTLSDLPQNVREKLNQVASISPKAFCCCTSASKDTCQAMDE
ncbi:hypothetical protein ZWY2020_056827 [Hordeum vulgare]|nr:hypothetical protein ZWY2020_056827 [Hordeum vulgare]